MALTLTKRAAPPNDDAKTAIAAAITRVTSGHERPLRVNWALLSDDEARDLIGLVEKADQPDGFGIGKLGKRDLARFEKLAEKGAGQPGYFQKGRDLDGLRVLGEQFRRERQTPPRRLALAQPGSVTLRKEWVFDDVRDGILWPSHVAVLVYLLAGWEGGALPVETPSATLDGETVRVDFRRGHLMPDPGEGFLDEEGLLDHLADNSFITIAKQGKKWSITRGSRLTAARKAAA